MITKLYKISGAGNDDMVMQMAAQLIRSGELVAFPTETVYGLGASALSADAAFKIYAAKGRPSDNPLIVHIADPADAESFAFTSPLYYRLAEAFMPGPLTVILPKKDSIPTGVTGGLNTVALRYPSHPAAQKLIRAAGVPIAAPSANRSGSPSPTTAEHVLRDMDGRIPLILDGGPCQIGLESTVIRLTHDGCEILRPGAVTKEMLLRLCPNVSVAEAVTDPQKAGENPQSPGMKYRHYAPVCEVVLVDGDEHSFVTYVKTVISDTEAVVISAEQSRYFEGNNVLLSGRTSSSEETAHSIFALLREADDKNYTKIYIRLPSKEGMDLALYNRLIRAASGNVVRI